MTNSKFFTILLWETLFLNCCITFKNKGISDGACRKAGCDSPTVAWTHSPVVNVNNAVQWCVYWGHMYDIVMDNAMSIQKIQSLRHVQFSPHVHVHWNNMTLVRMHVHVQVAWGVAPEICWAKIQTTKPVFPSKMWNMAVYGLLTLLQRLRY